MNDVYAINGLTAEVGEINDKVAKWVRKGICRIENNHLVFNTHDEELVAEYQEELAKEVGDVLWFVALLSKELGYTLHEVGQMNIDKLKDRAQRGVIVGNGDNR
jgi:NTP pyrophosphatase (non-canonical NTP hydrolase)